MGTQAATHTYSPSLASSRRPSVDSTLAPSITSTFRYAPSETDAASTIGSRTVGFDNDRTTKRTSTLRSILSAKLRRGNPAFEHPGDRGLTLLHRAVQRGDLESTTELITNGADINAHRGRNNSGMEETVLYLAIISANPAIVALLLQKGANVDAFSSDDWEKKTALHACALRNSLELAEMLLEGGAKVDLPDYHSKTALYHAATKDHAAMASLLLDAGADIEKKAAYEIRPLGAAIQAGSLSVVRLLLEAGADVHAQTKEYKDNSCLHAALSAPANTIGMLALLIGRGAGVDVMDKQGWTPMHTAASKGDVEACQMLLDAGADPHAKTDPPSFYENAELRPKHSVLDLAKRARNRSKETVEMIGRYTGSGRRGTVSSLDTLGEN